MTEKIKLHIMPLQLRFCRFGLIFILRKQNEGKTENGDDEKFFHEKILFQ